MTRDNPEKQQRQLRRIHALPGGPLWVFLVKQAWAALFGGLLLFAIIFTHYVHLPWLARYDWFFVWAIIVQIGMLAFRLEQPREVIAIVLFHLVGLGMELFKTSGAVGSWSYPEASTIRLLTVPLFSGFMYAAVGSYLTRAWRVLYLRFTHYPNRWLTALLALLIYINFFTHHYVYDIRYLLFAGVILLYFRTRVYFRLVKHEYSMPLLLGFVLIAFVIWLAENVGTFTHVWLYPSQVISWQPVGIEKWGSWFLLMIISFIMIDIFRASFRRADHR
jgi:uncharacterized membrane protein YoaT (DUF817 family)